LTFAHAFSELSRIQDIDSRNFIRGVLSLKDTTTLSLTWVNRLREAVDPADLPIATRMLLGKDGAFPFLNIGLSYQSLGSTHGMSEVSAIRDVAFVIGHLNGWKNACIDALLDVGVLFDLERQTPIDRLANLRKFAERWGVSDFLNKKFVHYMDVAKIDKAVSQLYFDFAGALGLEKYATPYFAAMESISDRYPYFENAKDWISLFSKGSTDDFRQHIALHNIAPTPLYERDIGPFLRKCHSMSIIDELMAVKILLSLSEEWPAIVAFIKTHLHREISEGFSLLDDHSRTPESITIDSEPADADFVAFRRSTAFLEVPSLARLRHKIDAAIAGRLLRHRYPVGRPKPYTQSTWREQKRNLVTRTRGFVSVDKLIHGEAGGVFLRTIEFLSFLSAFPNQLDFSEEELRFIFENTLSLKILLTEEELERLYQLGNEEARLIISTLALALYKERQHDEDIDFKFRHYMQQAIVRHFEGDIVAFIRWLSPASPAVARFITQTLDRSTIQKLYLLIGSAEEADDIRQKILRHMGEQLDNLSYFVEADRINAHNQIAKIKTYFDDSRVFVDGISLKKWFNEHPNAYLQEYRRMIEHSIATISRAALLLDQSGIQVVRAEMSTIASFDYMLAAAMQGTFDQFCTNRHFGIESYLGRRIRHNTLTGMMLGGVDSIIEGFGGLQMNGPFMDRYDEWLAEYKKLIEYIRVSLLQFRSDKNPKGLFIAGYEAASAESRKHIAELRATMLQAPHGEMFEDAVLRFCWAQFEPQLRYAQKYISVDLRSLAMAGIDTVFGATSEADQRQFIGLLRDTVHDRVSRLSSWFTVPENRLVAATTREIGNLIHVECEQALGHIEPLAWSGLAADLTISGSSVHRVYDCLFVLINNAVRYGQKSVPIELSTEVREVGLFTKLDVLVRSCCPSIAEAQRHKAKIEELVSATEDLSVAMVREGYSGLRKVIYITKEHEGASTLRWDIEGVVLTVGFTTTVDIGDLGFAGSPS